MYLTRREEQVYELLKAKKSNQQIATALGISGNTVKSHLFFLRKKGAIPRKRSYNVEDYRINPLWRKIFRPVVGNVLYCDVRDVENTIRKTGYTMFEWNEAVYAVPPI